MSLAFSAGFPEDGTEAIVSRETSKASQIPGIGQVWAIRDQYANEAIQALSAIGIAEAQRLQSQHEAIEIQAAAQRKAEGKPEPKPYEMVGSTAVMGVSGPMTKKPTSASFLMGGTSTIRAARALRSAMADHDVKNIAMIFDTPGGECAGCAEFADAIREVNAVKPITGFVDDECASAGLFALSQCNKVFMNRMGLVGCAGTMAAVSDLSGQAAMAGVKVKVFKSDGATYKGMGTPGTSMTPEQEQHLQDTVNHYGNDFKASVQFGRGFTDEQVAAVFTAQMFTSQEAMDLGLIDGVCSLEECLSMLSNDSPLAATAVPTQARATSAAKESPMNLKEFWASLRGNPEALAAANLDAPTIAALEAEANQDAPVATELATLKATVEQQATAIAAQQALNAQYRQDGITAQANQFWAELITPDGDGRASATWNMKDGVLATYAALSDNPVALEGYKSSMRNAPKNYLQGTEIPDGTPGARPNANLRMDLILQAAKKSKIGAETATKLYGGKN